MVAAAVAALGFAAGCAGPPERPDSAPPFGPGCSAVPRSGMGSFAEMSGDPVVTAASHLPMLTEWVHAVHEADMVATFDRLDHLTVFAPDNAAFARLPKDQLHQIYQDKDQVSKILTYQIVGHRVAPAELPDGSFTTLAKGTLTTRRSGSGYQVGDAKVVCGNIRTGNAQLYITDRVLTPPP
ncbi:lipoprotein (plasmid) [Streptantibioticus cattleyicolor NRRL 8057 = DSM 46488]|uniref:Lipoprotein n=1 Tax=Streptantibioticus cattleyicolor (strain ATCC 35852 / DSM 46488 / JCM 4925 / NBRC 14057 / NRRL 8057) TaxID=1003195 RepID=F8JM37_STREN|nr:lipoprotein [Streptantibioticus cattleyicolor NRRL 8057 = DSM 46488]CCB71519.1 Lipoprotein [Streptantibioticus cattleyicolor NRRL 8057 = DSM 46488]